VVVRVLAAIALLIDVYPMLDRLLWIGINVWPGACLNGAAVRAKWRVAVEGQEVVPTEK
jgi:hypothetical protein